jgi:hypothetical protein
MGARNRAKEVRRIGEIRSLTAGKESDGHGGGNIWMDPLQTAFISRWILLNIEPPS